MTVDAESGAAVVPPADIVLIAQDVWSSFLDVHLEPVAAGTESRAGADEVMAVAGVVEVHDAWRGSVVLECGLDVARAVTEAMFAAGRDDHTAGDARDVGDDEIVDAVGELANMVGGNVKSLLPAPSRLSLPFVHRGTWRPAVPATPISRVTLAAPGGDPIRVTVWQY